MRPNSGNLEPSEPQTDGQPAVDRPVSVPVSPLNAGIAGIDSCHPYPTPSDRLRSYLELANATPRCAHVRDNGKRCGSPAMNGSTLCYHHRAQQSEVAVVRALPRVTDARSFNRALAQVLADLYAGRVTCRTAGQLLYGLQIAALHLPNSGGEI